MLRFFYFVSYEVYDADGHLKTKGHKTFLMSEKIQDDDALRGFESIIRRKMRTPKSHQLIFISINLLNS